MGTTEFPVLLTEPAPLAISRSCLVAGHFSGARLPIADIPIVGLLVALLPRCPFHLDFSYSAANQRPGGISSGIVSHNLIQD
jgi:hypothetical protein